VYVAWLQDVWAGGSDVYAVDVEYVRSSHDHGASWSAHDYVGNPASNSLYGVFAAGADVWAVGDSGTGQGSILHSSDSGATWGWMTPPLVAGIPLLGVWASGALVVAKYGGGGIRSTDQGATWSAIGPLVCGYGFYVIGASATDVWTGDSEHACDNGSPPGHAVAVHSTDGALTWSSTFAPANASVHEVWTSAGEVFAVGTSYSPTAKTPSLWHSPDDGATWTPIPGPVTRFPAISFDHVWATAADDLWVVDSNQNIYRFH
jgi:hypothetical protein